MPGNGDMKWLPPWFVATVLAIYLVGLSLASLAVLIQIFPSTSVRIMEVATSGGSGAANGGSDTKWLNLSELEFRGFTIGLVKVQAIGVEQGLPLLAVLAGILGSFLHAGQSLGAFIGDGRFERSWFLWYVLRPPVGGLLGLLMYFVWRAGLASTVAEVSPYSVVALGALAGWFSKKATDKFAEMFDTLFQTRKEAELTGKQQASSPEIRAIMPDPVPAGTDSIMIKGDGFTAGARIQLANRVLDTILVDDGTLDVDIPVEARPAPGTMARIIVINKEPHSRPSSPKDLLFQ